MDGIDDLHENKGQQWNSGINSIHVMTRYKLAAIVVGLVAFVNLNVRHAESVAVFLTQ